MPLVTANQFQLAPDLSRIGTGIQQGAQLANQFQLMGQRKQAQQQQSTQFQQEQSVRRAEILNQSARALKGIPQEQRQAALMNMAPRLAEFNIDASVFQGADLSDQELDKAIASTQGFLAKPAMSSAEREFASLTSGLTPEEMEKARRIELGLAPRAVGSSAITTAQEDLTGAVAESEAQIAGAKSGATEKAKLKEQLKLKPAIAAAIKQAETEAKSRGETFTELARAKAALPGLKEVSAKLKSLADIATYTTTGKVFDLASKELGFGATKGATARSKMTSVVDNQVLPLLRDTFGAAFTAAEGDRLRDSLLDPDAAPEQKKATLDAFIDQKIRNIETKEREIGAGQQVDLTSLSDEELMQQIEAARGGQ